MPVLILIAAIALLYGRTLGYGLVWDDYVALRTRSAADLAAAWTGPWDPNGPWPVFYRPLSIALYQADFALFGHNGAALHAINLLMLLAAAWMTSTFVRRELNAGWTGTLAAVALIAHPETPASLAAWISQQFHLAELIAVLAALLAWQRVRDKQASSWWLILVPATLGALVKEDAVVIVPAIWLWQHARARQGLGAAPPRAVTAAFAAWGAGYVALRAMLVGMGGYGTPDVFAAAWNVGRGTAHALFIHVPPVHALGNVAAAGLIGAFAAAWLRRDAAPPAVRAFALGALALVACANVPLALISGHTRIHLLILAVAFLVTAAAATLVRSLPLPVWRRAAAAVGVWAALVAAANWLHTGTFAPCTPETLETDALVLQWDTLPSDGRAELMKKIAECAAR